MKKNIILISYIALMTMIVSSIAVSFAWFSYSNLLSMSNIKVNIYTDKDLKISVDDKNYSQSLDDEFINFEPVSTMFIDNDIISKPEVPNFRIISSEAKSRYSYKDELSLDYCYPSKLSGFYNKTIYLKTVDEYVSAGLDIENPLFVASEKANRETAKKIVNDRIGETEEDVFNSLNKSIKSLRLMILDPNPDTYKLYIIDPFKGDQPTYYAGRLSLFDPPYYDSEGGLETVYGNYKNRNKIVYDESITEDKINDPNQRQSAFNAITKSYIRAFNMEDSIFEGFEPAIEQSITLEQAKDLIKFKLEPNVSKKLNISVYIEGWDLDNTADTILGKFTSSIKFKIIEGD